MRKKTWFYRQLLSYIPAFFIMITFIFFVFFQLLSDQNRKEAIKANETLLFQVRSSIDSSLKTMEQMLMTELLNNKDLTAFFNVGKQNDYYLNLQVVEFMRDFKASYPLVDSMYLIRTSDQFVLSNATSSDLQQYSDYAFIENYLTQPKMETRWTGIRDFQEFDFQSPQHVVTLVLKAPFITDGQGFFVLNIASDSIKNIIESMYNKDISYIHIIDSNDSYILPANDSEQSNKEIVSLDTSPLTGWEYQSGFINGKWISFVDQLYNVWFLIGILMAIAGLFWIVLITRRSYKPIEQIVSQIQKFSQNKTSTLLQGNKQDEFIFIETALNSMLEQSNSFHQQSREDLILKKSYLFQQLLEGQYPSNLTQWDTQREKMQLNDLRKHQVVCMVKMDKYARFCSEYTQKDQYLMKFALNSVIQEIAHKYDTFVWTEWTSNSELGILLQIETGQDAEQQVLMVLENARAWIEEHLKMTITAGVGETAADYTQIPESYEQALRALKYKMILGENKIILYARMDKEKQDSTSFDSFGLISSMTQSFRLGKEEWRDQYKRILRNIEHDVLDRDSVLSLAEYMIYSFGREMNRMAKEFQDLWAALGQPSLNEALKQSDTLEQMEHHFGQALEQLYEQIGLLQESRNHSDTIRKIRSYMEQESANPNLSLDYLSDLFDISSKSLSKLFKEETGQKFVDYLIELRIRHAQKLLEETHLSIQDIAEQVGYANVISFGRMFKKIVCQSPGEYRERISTCKTETDSAG